MHCGEMARWTHFENGTKGKNGSDSSLIGRPIEVSIFPLQQRGIGKYSVWASGTSAEAVECRQYAQWGDSENGTASHGAAIGRTAPTDFGCPVKVPVGAFDKSPNRVRSEE